MKILLDMNLPPAWVDFLENVMPGVIGSIVVNAINKFMAEIQSGSLISIEMHTARIHILPFE